MIRYKLRCETGHEFEAWFGSISAFERQAAEAQVACVHCGSTKVERAPMAPALAKTGDGTGRKGEREALIEKMRALREDLTRNAENVGEAFPEEARKMYFSEAPGKSIYGKASPAEAKALTEEGVPVLPLPPLPEDQN
jgi:hypothetical protein